jgi:aminocarboxymuconate-semialdehyde decarboxylase
MLIDVHAHALSEELVGRMVDTADLGWALLKDGPGRYRFKGAGPLDPLIYDVGARLDSLKRRGVALQLVSPPPSIISNGDRVVSVDEARLLNESTARLVAKGGGQLAGLAVPALGEPMLAAEELRRSIDEHGFVGVVIGTAAGTASLDDPAFEQLFAAFECLDLLVFMHPTSSALSATQSEYSLRTLVTWPTETTIAVARLIFSGLIERHPRLKIILAHGGGTLPNLAGRLDLGWSAPLYEANEACRESITRPPSAYLKSFYFDTVVADPALLEFIVQSYGAEHVLFGTDFPYEIGDSEGPLGLAALDRLAEVDRLKIMSGNARRLLGKYAPSTL